MNVFDAALLAIGNSILTQSAALKKRFNETLPVYRLPPELFTSILLMDLREHLIQPYSRRHRLWQLALVSSKWWKTISLGTIFWTNIAFKRDDVNLCLRKSRNALLDIMCVSFHGEASWFMEIVATAAHRWRSIALSCGTGRDLVHQLRNPMPELTDMQVDVRIRDEPLPEGQPILQLQGLSKLRHLCLVNVGFQWENLKLENLVSLQLADIAATAPTLSSITAVLRASPDLEQLALRNIGVTGDRTPPAQTTIHLSRLQSLQLASIPQEALRHLMSAIESPQLTAIKVVGCPDSYFVGNTHNLTEVSLMKYLPSIMGKLGEIQIVNDVGHRQIEITSLPVFGRDSEWVSWATSAHTDGLHITVPTENARQSLDRIIPLLSDAGLGRTMAPRVRLSVQALVGSTYDLPEGYEGCFNAELLTRLPTLTHLSAVDPTDVRGILRHLGQCRQGSDGTWGYSCPRLEVLDIEASSEAVERNDIEVFIAERYGDGEPFLKESQLVKRPPDLVEFALPWHLEEEPATEEYEDMDWGMMYVV